MRSSIITTIFGLMAQSTAAGLLPRDSACGDPSYTTCAGANVPSNFCCPSNTQCIPLNGHKSIICCPAGSNCQFIAPIPCDISQQNATAHPQNPIKSTNLTATLESCGSSCCPQGYGCQDGQCAMQSLPSSVPTSSAPSSAPTIATPTSSPSHPSSTSLPSQSAASSAAAGAAVAAAASCPTFPGKAVAVGFFPGMLLGGLLSAAGILLLNRKKTISAPILQPQNVCRSDFLRKEPIKPRSIFRKSEAPSDVRSDARSDLRSDLRSETYSDARSESTSMEFVLSSGPLRASHNTNFTDLMEGAGFRRGEPFLLAADGRSRDA
ncbi:MAG: hypothetical protein M1838_004348 [Thelocarpon superellum]|nr:MAG: hypothetical protein M1838_004348 [Thelocarpon superellum]